MTFFDPSKLLLIAGPCSLESWSVCEQVADKLAALRDSKPELNIIFKGSYDKANRTSLGSDRGPGIDEGLALLSRVKKKYGFSLVTDFHTAEQAGP